MVLLGLMAGLYKVESGYNIDISIFDTLLEACS